MKKLLISFLTAILLQGCAVLSDHNVLVAKFYFGAVVLTEQPCTNPKVLAQVPTENKKDFKAGYAKGDQIGRIDLCYGDLNSVYIVVDENESQGIIPKDQFKKDKSV